MAKQQKKLGEILVEWGIITQKEVAKALAQQHNMEYFDLEKSAVPANAAALVPEELMRKHLILPLSVENGRLRLAIHDPLDLEMLDILRFRLNKDVRTVLAPKGRIKSILDEIFGASSGPTDKTVDRTIDRLRDSLDKSLDRSLDKSVDKSVDRSIDVTSVGEEGGDDATQRPMIKLVREMLSEACRTRASDVHIEPMKDRVQIRFRIDGECVIRDLGLQPRMKGPLISRVKIMAGIDISEKRLPQDGRIKMVVDKGSVDFRVSTLPAVHGESVVLRILRPESVRIGVTSLGLEEDDYKAFQKTIKRPNGIFLVTGPTGSGKTTTLYGALNELNRPDRKIITAEDPVEYNFTGINQCQVREAIGLSFAKILRAMLRQAPNIILVGEIRDKEVAEVAVQAALTGHLVFSTLHTNDAPSAITRLIDMGVKPFLVASSIQAVMAQRLIRSLCPKCKKPDDNPDEKWLRLAGIRPEDYKDKPMFKPVGCDFCTGTGFRGRKGIFEMMVMNNQLRALAFERAPTNKVRRAAIDSGMKTLLQDGKAKVLHGVTTAEEIVKVAQVEGVLS